MSTTITPAHRSERATFDPNAESAALESIEIMATGTRADFDRLIHPEFVNHEARDEPPGSRVADGPAAAWATALWLRAAFGELRFEIHDVVAERDLVVVHCTMSGHHRGDFVAYDADAQVEEAFPPTGERFATTQTHWCRIEDGKLIEHWANRDDLGMAKQLGWVPPTPAYLGRMALAKRRAKRELAATSPPRRLDRAGDVIENPMTGERAVVLESPDETGGERYVALLHVSPGGAVAGEHHHPYTDERFLVLDGELGVRRDGRDLIARAGDELEIKAGVVHDWWNAGDGEAKVLIEISPPGRFMEMIGTIFALARSGETDSKGMPKILQGSLLAKEFDDMIRFSSPPRIVQRVVFGALAPIARLRGYRGSRDYGERERTDPKEALREASGSSELPEGWRPKP